MKGPIGILACVAVAASITLAAPDSASAGDVTTLHGSFAQGTGYYEGQPGTGTELGRSGTWNVTLAPQGPRVAGNLSVLHGPCVAGPCQCTLPLSALPWEGGRQDTWYVMEVNDWMLGQVEFDFPLTIVPDGHATMRVDISGCPYQWDYWTFSGPSSSS